MKIKETIITQKPPDLAKFMLKPLSVAIQNPKKRLNAKKQIIR